MLSPASARHLRLAAILVGVLLVLIALAPSAPFPPAFQGVCAETVGGCSKQRTFSGMDAETSRFLLFSAKEATSVSETLSTWALGIAAGFAAVLVRMGSAAYTCWTFAGVSLSFCLSLLMSFYYSYQARIAIIAQTDRGFFSFTLMDHLLARQALGVIAAAALLAFLVIESFLIGRFDEDRNADNENR